MWIEHDGKQYPQHAELVDEVYVRFRDGYETTTPVHVWTFVGRAGNNWKWGSMPDRGNDIVAYRHD